LAGSRGVVQESQPPAGLQEAYEPRRIALVVGIDQYGDASLGDLQYAAKDASDLYQVLGDPLLGGFDEVVPLTGQANRRDFWHALELAGDMLQRDDTFLLYFAGHGTLEYHPLAGTQLYLLASDAELDRAAQTGVGLDQLEEALRGLVARRRVLVVDACFSGTHRSRWSKDTQDTVGGMRSGRAPAPAAYEISRYDARLYSAHYDQPAMEDPGLQNGVYTHFLVQALAGSGDADGDGLVDVLEAHLFALDRTLGFTEGAQVPWLHTTQVGRDTIIISGDPAQRAVAEQALLWGGPDPRGQQLRIDGRPRGAGGVEPGWHRVEVAEQDQVLADARVHLRAGERLMLGELIQQRQASLLLGAGLSYAPSGALTPRFSGQLSGWYWPRDTRGGRPGFGLAVAYGTGDVGALGEFPVGDAQVRASWAWGGRFQLGPSLGAGLVWRLPEQGGQVGAQLLPGLHARLGLGPVFLALDPALRLVSLDDGLRALPAFGLHAGALIRGRR